MPQLNPDGYSVKGCSIIYAPKSQAGEYARLATNMYRGCGHKCLYCYVPLVLKMTRAEFDAGAKDRAVYRKQLPKDAAKYQALGITEQVLLCFTTDPYHPFDTSLTRETIEVLKAHGMAFCTLTKGGSRALRDLDLFRPERDAFASSLTLLDPAASAKWEAGAATPADRIATLRRFREAGIYTWVSLEPVLDPDVTLEIIRRTHTFVDLYKVGRVNYSPLTKRLPWEEFTHRVIELLAETGSDHYIKEDLQPYLPEGYRNEIYRPQRRESGGGSTRGVTGHWQATSLRTVAMPRIRHTGCPCPPRRQTAVCDPAPASGTHGEGKGLVRLVWFSLRSNKGVIDANVSGRRHGLSRAALLEE